MATEDTEQTTTNGQADDTGTSAATENTDTRQDGQQEHGPVSYARFKEVNEKLRSLEAAQSKAAKEAEKLRQEELIEQQKWQQLAEELGPKAERAKALEKVVAELVKARTEALPEDKRPLIPDGLPEVQLAWLAKAEAAGMFGKVAGPKLHGGSGTGSGATGAAVKADVLAKRGAVLERYGIDAEPEDIK